MFIFAIGTVPLMLTFGAVSGLLSKGYTKKILKFSGVLIIVLGLIMGNRGFALAGINLNPITAFGSASVGSTNPNIAKATLQDGSQVINMAVDYNGYTPNAFYVKKGVPIKWVVDGQKLNTCNNTIIVRDLNLEWKLKKGENIQEFTPGDKDLYFSCWMGMLRGVIKVVDDLKTVDISKADSSLPRSTPGRGKGTLPLGEESSVRGRPSIYGDDLSKVPTEELLSVAQADGKNYSTTFKGIGEELKPLIAVTKVNEKTKLIFDFSDYDKAESEHYIVGVNSGRLALSFKGKKGIIEVEFTPKEAGGYAIIEGNNNAQGIIQVVDDLKSADLNEIKSQYIP